MFNRVMASQQPPVLNGSISTRTFLEKACHDPHPLASSSTQLGSTLRTVVPALAHLERPQREKLALAPSVRHSSLTAKTTTSHTWCRRTWSMCALLVKPFSLSLFAVCPARLLTMSCSGHTRRSQCFALPGQLFDAYARSCKLREAGRPLF